MHDGAIWLESRAFWDSFIEEVWNTSKRVLRKWVTLKISLTWYFSNISFYCLEKYWLSVLGEFFDKHYIILNIYWCLLLSSISVSYNCAILFISDQQLLLNQLLYWILNVFQCWRKNLNHLHHFLHQFIKTKYFLQFHQLCYICINCILSISP